MANFPWLDAIITTWSVFIAVSDYRQRRIPNGLTMGAAVIAVAYLLLCHKSLLGASPFSASLAGIGAICLLIPFSRLGWLGMGDIKLMSAIGLMGGIETLTLVFVLSSLLALPVALWLQLLRHKRQSASERRHLPQGVFLALGLILSLISGVRPNSI